MIADSGRDQMSCSEDVLNGFYCQECGQIIDFTEPGIPRTCSDCDDNGYKVVDVEEAYLPFL
jgi:Fe2+ or Zn2+ uptake regulation protein